MAGLLVAWLSITPPYFATSLYWNAVATLIPDALPDETAELQ